MRRLSKEQEKETEGNIVSYFGLNYLKLLNHDEILPAHYSWILIKSTVNGENSKWFLFYNLPSQKYIIIILVIKISTFKKKLILFKILMLAAYFTGESLFTKFSNIWKIETEIRFKGVVCRLWDHEWVKTFLMLV